jgi:RNA polymerase sigma-70 factor (ECF subfamily)
VEEPSDADAIAASWTDATAFGVIFDRHATRLRRYLVRRLGPDEAEGMLGDVFLIAFERRASYDTNRPSAAPWLYGIATNLVARHRRREFRRLRATARLAARRPAQVDEADSVSGAVDAADRWERVAEAVAALPELERDTMVLAVWEGLSYEDIAIALDIPIGTVRSRLNRARGRLRELAEPVDEGHTEHTAGRDAGRIGS